MATKLKRGGCAIAALASPERHGEGAGRGRPESRRPRARALARHRSRFRPCLAQTSCLRGPARADAGLSRETINVQKQRCRDAACRCGQLGSLPPRPEGVGARRGALGRPQLALPALGLRDRSRHARAHGKGQLAQDCTSQDWGASPTTSSSAISTASSSLRHQRKAGNLRGRIVPAEPLRGDRLARVSNPPSRPLRRARFTQAAEKMGYKPFPTPTGAVSRRLYQRIRRETSMPACTAAIASSFGCRDGREGEPETAVLPNLMKQKNFELRTHGQRHQGEPRRRRKARHRRHVRRFAAAREFEQPAADGCCCAPTCSTTCG